jgi:hypothetical protein
VITDAQVRAASLAVREHGIVLGNDVLRVIITAAADAAPVPAEQPGRSGSTLLDETMQWVADARLDRLETAARNGHASPGQMIKLIAELRRLRTAAREGAAAPRALPDRARAANPGRAPRSPGR